MGTWMQRFFDGLGGKDELALFVGNGVSLDLAKQFSESTSRNVWRTADEWDTRSPLSWAIDHPNFRRRLLLDSLEELKEQVSASRQHNDTISDFAILADISQSEDPDSIISETAWQARHYLAQAFSEYQSRSDRFNSLDEWAWVQLLRKEKDSISVILSLNYDLNIERAAKVTKRPVEHLASYDGTDLPMPSKAIGVIKPHGSINYGLPPNVFKYGRQFDIYSSGVRIVNSDYKVNLLADGSLRFQRLEADLVLPGEPNIYKDMYWVTTGINWLKNKARRIQRIIIAGVSYGEVDRPELDAWLGFFPSTAEVTAINPSFRNASSMREFRHRLESQFDSVRYVPDVRELLESSS